MFHLGFDEIFRKARLSGLSSLGETTKQAAYRACLLKQKSGAKLNCVKPVRKAKVICQEVGGSFANRQCTFPTPVIGTAVSATAGPTATGTGPTVPDAVVAAAAAATLPKPGSTVHGPIPAEWAGTEKTGAKGPAQKKCERQGGHWIGPERKRWCQIPAGAAPTTTALTTTTPGTTGPALPKPGSTVYGPIPAEWAGTEKTGAKGPLQRKCEAQGGHWIGPNRKRWCQVPPAQVAPPSDLVVTDVTTPDTTTPGVTDDQQYVPPQDDYQQQQDTGLVNGGGGGGGGGQVVTTPYDTYGGGGGGGGTFDEYGYASDQGAAAAAAAAMAGPMNECSPEFSNYLPQTYPDKFGPMTVLAVFCAGGAAGASQEPGMQAVEAVEQGELYELTSGEASPYAYD